jgi:hypothetical protein
LMPREGDHPQHRSWVCGRCRWTKGAWIYLDLPGMLPEWGSQ